MPDPIRDCDFWRGPLEAETYLTAVHMNPRREGEGAMSYIVRISDLVQASLAQDERPMRAAGDVQ